MHFKCFLVALDYQMARFGALCIGDDYRHRGRGGCIGQGDYHALADMSDAAVRYVKDYLHFYYKYNYKLADFWGE